MIGTRYLVVLGVVVTAAALQGCASGPQPLYSWGTFPHYQYDALRGEGDSPAQQILGMEQQSQKAASEHLALPPGFRAHLGKLYYDTGDVNRAAALWAEEKAAFPESAPYMDSLLKRVGSQDKTGDKA
jgi:hypothetical protein